MEELSQPDVAATDGAANDIAVTVIGGYLGAGKTTLLNHILRTADQRIAVLVNDFGDINIDEGLIASQDGDTISLANGCICCSLIGGFSAALEVVRERRPLPQRLIIESSGVADPATVAAYGHGPGLNLDATVVVVDAETIQQKASDKYVGDTVVQQLGSGDIIVMNKVDLVNQATTEATERWLQERAPDAVVIEATNAEVDPALLFGVVKAKAPHHQHDNGDKHGASLFESWSWTSEEPLGRDAVERMMEAMPPEVVRIKGLIVLEDEPDKLMALQGVGRRWSIRQTGSKADSSASEIVAIGFHGAIIDGWIAQQLSSGQ